MPTSEHAYDEVEGLFDIIEEILEEDGKGDTKTPSEWGTGRVLLEMNHIGTLLNHMAQEERITEAKWLLTFLKEMD